MATWQSLLTKMVKDAPIEPVYFCIRPPAGKPWPKLMPSTPTLVEFYSLCDGGNLSALEVFSMDTIKTERATMLRAIDMQTIAAGPEHIFVFGYNPQGFVYFADTENDLVSAYNPKTAEWDHHNQTFESFLEDLFTPGSIYHDGLTDEWAQVLEQVENMA
jgi:hypothetical protein